MGATAGNILRHAETLPEGAILTAEGLLQFGGRAAVGQALASLVREDKLLRVARGMYVALVTSRFGTRPPSAHAVAQALPAIIGGAVEPHGIAAANSLGLTTQVPVRPVYLTSARSRKFKLGEQILEIRHVPKWQMLVAGRPAGTAIRALAWLGENNASAVLLALREKLSAEE